MTVEQNLATAFAKLQQRFNALSQDQGESDVLKSIIPIVNNWNQRVQVLGLEDVTLDDAQKLSTLVANDQTIVKVQLEQWVKEDKNFLSTMCKILGDTYELLGMVDSYYTLLWKAQRLASS